MKVRNNTIYFSIDEAKAAQMAAQAKFGKECGIVGLGDGFFKIVQHGDGVNTATSSIAELESWWEPEWDEVAA